MNPFAGRIAALPDRVEVDDENRLTQAPQTITLDWEEVVPLLRLNGPQGLLTPEELAESIEAGRVEIGRRVTYNGSDRSIVYEIRDWDGQRALLERAG